MAAENPAVYLPSTSVQTGEAIRTLVDLSIDRAQVHTQRTAYTFLAGSGETEQSSLTFGELDVRARAIAAKLQTLDARGERVLLLFPPGSEFIAAFLGCLYAGAVAVPAYPPRANDHARRLRAIMTDAQAAFALTTAQLLSRSGALLAEATALGTERWIATDELDANRAADWQKPLIDGDTLAFLQYTSGSTSNPKGVMVTHANLLHNEGMIRRAFGQSEESVIVSWLPLYHDMGLIGAVLQPLYLAARCVLMSPVAFLQRPARWLEAISRYRATTSGGPNFAYDLCVRKVGDAERATLDLSSWTTAFNGAEPVRASTVERFAERFAPCGFRRAAFQPCYGLAEATLFVSGGGGASALSIRKFQARELESNRAIESTDAREEGTTALVSCGLTQASESVAIVRAETKVECAPEEIGEIWVSGKSVARGYWNRPEETVETFNARLNGTRAADVFLRTGDLGFLHKGELFVTGRLKDLLIIRGRNHYPQDIEATVEQCHEALRPGGGAAFSVEAVGEERLALVHEVKGHGRLEFQALVDAIREAVAAQHEVQVSTVLLVKPGNIPKTSSGKIQRRACRERFLRGEFEALYEWRADADLNVAFEGAASPVAPSLKADPEGWLVAQVAACLGVEAQRIDANQPLTRYGIDSLQATELSHSIETALRIEVPMATLLQGTSIAQLALQLREPPAAVGDAQATRLPMLSPSGQQPTESRLSQNQNALWFLYQLAPESAAYNLSSAVRIRQEIDSPALRCAFQSLVDAHPALRTTFAVVAGKPVQRIHKTLEVAYTQFDASAWDEHNLREHLTREAQRPFDLEHETPFRVGVYTRSAQEHFLLLVVHHIVADFRSLALLLRQLGEAYEAGTHGLAPTLAPPALAYTDFVRWQAELVSSVEGERLWSYWKNRLGGKLPVLDLPADRPRPPVQSYRGASENISLGLELSGALKHLAAQHDTTLFVALLAAFKTLLHKYTGQEEILVGTTTAGRRQPSLAQVVGYFVNMLALRTELGGDPTFKTLLSRTHGGVMQAFEHQDYPFTHLVERLQPDRDLSRSPIFDVAFVLQKTHRQSEEGFEALALGLDGERINLSGLALETIALERLSSPFDLMLMMAEAGGELVASFQYHTDLFDPSTIRRMASHFRTLLHSIVAEPDQPLSQLRMLSEKEREQLLIEWNDTATECPRHLCIHQLFEQQVARTPDAIALVFEEQQLTYAQLNERANQLARHLRSLGVGTETLVGILMERSVEMVVSLLAVLKAGGAYLPLDAQYPVERLSFMLEDAGAPVLLTQEHLRGSVGEYTGHVLSVDTQWAEISVQSGANVESGSSAENLAYVIYTSGSTGRPKGVAIPHRCTAAFIHWSHCAFSASQTSCVLASTSICFDLSIFEIFVPLARGGRVLLVRDALELAERELAVEATLLNTVPSAAVELLRLGALPKSIETVNLAGEALSMGLVDRLYEQDGIREVRNLYGPTEDTTYSTYALMERGRKVSIGHPITNTSAYIVDEWMNPVPVGVTGELYLGGEGLARGYLNRPELTAEKFIPNPFSRAGGARLYRTGDLARYQADGNIEYLGRADHQVKVRGYRIEMGEIESALGQHSGVESAVVIVREERGGEKRLVAYVVAQDEAEVSSGELREHLRARLPEYMLPAQFVMLDALPLTPNGKVDRRALPAPEQAGGADPTQHVAPRTPTEEMLCGIWREVLRVERVGIHDNFFEVGGHSLLATQLVSRVRELFAVELALRTVFESPTVAELAVEVEGLRGAAERAVVPPLVRVEREESLPLSFAQQRLWFLDQLQPGSSFYNIPIAMRVQGRLDAGALEGALSEVVSRHEALRTHFAAHDGVPVQVISAPAPVTLRVTDLSGMSEAERGARVTQEAEREAQRPFDLARGPLLRAALLRLGDEEHVLLLTMHHIISDGWSMGVLVKEVTTLYEAYARGAEATLPPLPIQYADYAVWQRNWLQGDVLEQELAYWRKALAGAPALLGLPLDHARPAEQSYRGASLSFALTPELSAALRELSRREGATLFMTLLAAFQTLLSRYSGEVDICVGTPIANRTQAEVEGLIGFFVNTLVMRGDLSGEPSFRELVRRTREVTLGGYAHQEVPFEKLVEELQPEREMSHHPLFQVMLALQNAGGGGRELAGLELAALEVESRTAKFDVTLSVEEEEEQQRGGGLRCHWEYNTELFERSTIERMAEHFRRVLEAVVAEPERPLSKLPLLSDKELHRLLVEWNDTATEYPRTQCIHHLFEAQVARTPDAVALVFEEQQLTYRQLNQRANQLAHHLRTLGVQPEARVGLLLARHPDLLVSLLAILKAGGAYVPLDPAYPPERLAFIIADASLSTLLTQQSLLARLPPPQQAHALVIDHLGEELSVRPTHNPSVHLERSNLAYVIYTSGSTGQPKGVAITQGSVASFIQWARAHFRRADLQGVLAATSINFDLSVFELFAPLSCGGTVVLAANALELGAAAARHEVTLINVVPSALAELLRTGAVPATVRIINSGGEAITAPLVEEVYARLGDGVEVWDLYGPTEDTVYSLNRRLAAGEVVTIGRPIANTQAYILDAVGEPTPVGVVGELHLGGEGLARGYMNRAQLTAEKFIPNPFSREAGARLYRTGDLARYQADGDIEYLGRADYQVKVRGFRIELGEIETVLAQHPSVRDAVVVVRGEAEEKRLAAYVVAQDAATVSVKELREHVRVMLPEYMTPAQFVMLDALPLTPNGKVDRRALPAPEQAMGEDYIAPRTPTEEALATIWCEVLRVEQVGVHDNFFEVGGHSLLATQLASRIKATFGVDVPLRRFFELATIESLAEAIERMQVEQADEERLAEVLAELELLSDDEAEALIAEDIIDAGAS